MCFPVHTSPQFQRPPTNTLQEGRSVRLSLTSHLWLPWQTAWCKFMSSIDTQPLVNMFPTQPFGSFATSCVGNMLSLIWRRSIIVFWKWACIALLLNSNMNHSQMKHLIGCNNLGTMWHWSLDCSWPCSTSYQGILRKNSFLMNHLSYFRRGY